MDVVKIVGRKFQSDVITNNCYESPADPGGAVPLFSEEKVSVRDDE